MKTETYISDIKETLNQTKGIYKKLNEVLDEMDKVLNDIEKKSNKGLVNGGVFKKTFNIADENIFANSKQGYVRVFFDDGNSATFSLDWWNRKWGEQA